ncbi:MAG: GyrI-like domain-containing protein [Anaerolineaceae bacterium]|nr:GyrI-like domain-containing protein [Anaerolineaceae bacterium]
MDKPTIMEIGPFLLAGFSFYGDPFAYHMEWENENEIGQLWSRFYQSLEGQPEFSKIVQSGGIMYEMHLLHPQSKATGRYEVFIGAPYTTPAQLPVHFLLKNAPAKRYLQYRVNGTAIVDDPEHLPIDRDMHEFGYQRDPTYHFVGYDDQFLGMDRLDESTVLILIPILES